MCRKTKTLNGFGFTVSRIIKCTVGHTGIHAFGDCIRRIGLGRFATVVELRIPCIHALGVSKI